MPGRGRYISIDYGSGVVRRFSPECVKRLHAGSLAALRELTREWAESLPYPMEDAEMADRFEVLTIRLRKQAEEIARLRQLLAKRDAEIASLKSRA